MLLLGHAQHSVNGGYERRQSTARVPQRKPDSKRLCAGERCGGLTRCVTMLTTPARRIMPRIRRGTVHLTHLILADRD